MPQEKVSMRKIKEVLRLRFDLGLQQNQIARSCCIGQATVHRYLEKAAAAGLSWPLPDDLDDRRLEDLLFPVAAGRPSQGSSKVDSGSDYACFLSETPIIARRRAGFGRADHRFSRRSARSGIATSVVS